VDTHLILKSDKPTGQAFIMSFPDGNNSIIINPGANHAFNNMPDSWFEAVQKSDILLL